MKNVVMEADEAEYNPCCAVAKLSNLGSSARLWGSSGRPLSGIEWAWRPGTLTVHVEDIYGARVSRPLRYIWIASRCKDPLDHAA